MSIPLHLKVKLVERPTGTPVFTVSENSVAVGCQKYDFASVFTTQNDLLSHVNPDTCTIFMGPTGSGKTTSLKAVAEAAITKGDVDFLTAFEVSGQRYVTDLLDGKRKGPDNLKKHELSGRSTEIIDQIFSRRSTTRTAFNSVSSRSCLILTFHRQNERTTFIDMMGNEKYDRKNASSSVFANSNMLAITQLLAGNSAGRSANLVANLIFRSHSVSSNIEIVLHLDQYGDAALAKSALRNIADLIKDFSPAKAKPEATFDPKMTPSYARPTASSSSPIRKGASPSTERFRTPLKAISPPKLAQKNFFAPKTSRPILATPTRRLEPAVQVSVAEPTRPVSLKRARTSETARMVTSAFYENEIGTLKTTIGVLEIENNSLVSAVALSEAERCQWQNEKTAMERRFVSEVSELKEDLSLVREVHSGLHGAIASLRATLSSLLREGTSLRNANVELSDALQMSRDQNELAEMNCSWFKCEFERVEVENSEFKRQIQNLEKTNDVRLGQITAELAEQNRVFLQLVAEKQAALSENEKLSKIVSDNTSTISAQKEVVDSLTKENDHLVVELHVVSSENMALLQRVVDLEVSGDELRNDHYQMAQLVSKKDEELAELRSALKAAESANNELHIGLIDTEHDLASAMMDLESSHTSEVAERLQQELVEVKRVNGVLAAETEAAVAENGHLSGAVRQLTEQFESLLASSRNEASKMAVLAEQYGVCEEERGKLSEANFALHEENSRLVAAGEAERNANDELRRANLVFEETNSELREANSELSTENNLLRERLSDTMRSAAETCSQKAVLAERYEEAIAARDQMQNHQLALSSEVLLLQSELQGTVSHWTKKYEDLAQTNSQITADLERKTLQLRTETRTREQFQLELHSTQEKLYQAASSSNVKEPVHGRFDIFEDKENAYPVSPMLPLQSRPLERRVLGAANMVKIDSYRNQVLSSMKERKRLHRKRVMKTRIALLS